MDINFVHRLRSCTTITGFVAQGVAALAFGRFFGLALMSFWHAPIFLENFPVVCYPKMLQAYPIPAPTLDPITSLRFLLQEENM